MVSNAYILPVDHVPENFFQRSVYVECRGSEKYWDLIDARLEFIRSKSEGSAVKIARCCYLGCWAVICWYSTYRAFTELLKTDRDLYGMDEDYVITDVVADDWQQHVDNVVGGLDNVAEA